MSGIFGFINLDGRPASPESFQKMADEMAGWGPDGVGSILSGNAAFGHALLVVTHESRFEKMPIHDQDEGILFTAAARLDNRDELCDLFGIAHPERPITSDGQLVLKAYKKWGSESCKHLFGDWSFAVWNIKDKRLFLARDHLGNTGLYYYFKPPSLVFASNQKAILVHPMVPCDLDEIYLAKKLVFDYSEETLSQTFWKDVCYLPAAHTITLSKENQQIEKYWSLDTIRPTHLSRDSQYIESFLDLFRRAVRVRLNSIRPVGCTLSAGLDSSSVTALAAEVLREKREQLIAYTSIPLYAADNLFPRKLTNEWPSADEVAASYANIEHVPVRAEDLNYLEAIWRSLYITHEPQHAPINMNWIVSIFDDARRRNLGVMLTGQLGNGGVSWSGSKNYIFSLFMHNDWQKGWRALKARKMRDELSWFRAIKSQLLRPILLPFWSKYQQFIHCTRQKELSFSFAREDFINRMGFKKVTMSAVWEKHISQLTERLLMTMRNGTMAGKVWSSFGAFYKMDVRDPTADVRLLEFCMSVPDEQNTCTGGERMLIRRAMNGILPDSVRLNNIRGKQSADAVFRLINQQEAIDKELTRLSSEPDVLNYLDISAMQRIWANILVRRTPTSAIDSFLRSINYAYFLLSLSEHR